MGFFVKEAGVSLWMRWLSVSEWKQMYVCMYVCQLSRQEEGGVKTFIKTICET